MSSFRTFFLVVLLPLLIASEIVAGQDTLTLIQTVTETRTVVLPSEPNVPPAAGWPTNWLSQNSPATQVLLSTLPGTITRTAKFSTASPTDKPYSCFTDASDEPSCVYHITSSVPQFTTAGCQPTSSVITITVTDSWCEPSHKPSHTSSSASSSSFCNPILNISYWGNVSTWSPRTTSTALPVGTTPNSASACDETETETASIPIHSTQSNSPHSLSSSSSQSRTTPHQSGGYYPSTTSSSPITAGSRTLEPRVLAGMVGLVVAVLVGFA